MQSTCVSGEGRSITEVADVVTLWTDLRADIQLKTDVISKRTRLEVTGCGKSITNSKEYFSLFTVSYSRQGHHYLFKTNYKPNKEGELQVFNTHTYNIASYTYQNQKLELYIESYNDVQGLIRGCITLEPQHRVSYHI
jgi:hypothetical protein